MLSPRPPLTTTPSAATATTVRPPMVSTNTYSSAAAASLSQVVAMAFAYRRLLLVWLAAGPGGVLAGRLVLGRTLYQVLRWVSSGFPGTFVLVAVILDALWRQVVLVLTTTNDTDSATKEKQARRQSAARRWGTALLLSAAGMRWMVAPLYRFFVLRGVDEDMEPNRFGESSLYALWSTLWWALGLALLGLVVILRYVGPQSIVRCSVFPLISNPYKVSVLSLAKDPLSILEPSDQPGELLTSSLLHRRRQPQNIPNQQDGRRYQYPTIHAFAAQLVLSILLSVAAVRTTGYDGVLLSWLDVDTMIDTADWSYWAILSTCLLATSSPLVMSWYPHELDPRRYYQLLPWSWKNPEWHKLWAREVLTKLGPTVTLVPPLALVWAHVMTWFFSTAGTIVPTFSWKFGLLLYLDLMLECAVVCLYLHTLDLVVRTHLMVPPIDLPRLVEEFQDDTTPVSRLEVILQSLMLDDASLVQQVWKPSYTPTTWKQEQQRLQQEQQQREQELARLREEEMMKQAWKHTLAPSWQQDKLVDPNKQQQPQQQWNQNQQALLREHNFQREWPKEPVVPTWQQQSDPQQQQQAFGGQGTTTLQDWKQQPSFAQKWEHQEPRQQEKQVEKARRDQGIKFSVTTTVAVAENCEQAEVERMRQLMKQLGEVFLSSHSSDGRPVVEARLEEDVLRVAILESMGGTCTTTKDGSPRPHFLQGDARHERNIQEWVDYKFPRSGGRNRESLLLPLVRGLSVFIGGMGEALSQCSRPTASTKSVAPETAVNGISIPPPPTSSRPQRNVGTWTLPAGAIFAAQCAVTAMTRFVVESLTGSGQPRVVDWKSSRLSILLPSVLYALYSLREGVMKFAAYAGRIMVSDSTVTDTLSSGSVQDFPELQFLVTVCDEATLRILAEMKIPKPVGSSRVDLPLDEECRAWIRELLMRT